MSGLGKLKKCFWSIALVICMVFISNGKTKAAMEDINFVQYNDTSALKKLDNSTLNTYLFSQVKNLEPKLMEEFKKSCKYLDGFKVNGLNFNVDTGEISLNLYAHFKTKILGIKVTTHADFTAKCKILVSGDFKNFGCRDLKVTKFDINNCPNWLDGFAKDLANKEIDNVIWVGGTVPEDFEIFNKDIFVELANWYLESALKNNFVEEVDYLGKVEGAFEVQVQEMDLSQGMVTFQINAKITIGESTLTRSIITKFDFFLDGNDNRLVAKVSPEITVVDADSNDILQIILKQIWKNAIQNNGEYIKL